MTTAIAETCAPTAAPAAKRVVTLGLLGCGTVGRGLVQLIARNRELIRARTGVELRIGKILVRNLEKDRPGVDPRLLTARAEDVLENGCDIVVEVIGGLEPSKSLIEGAIAAGKHVVTANKALLALSGAEIFRRAAARGVRLGFEASVCGGLPIIRAIQSGLVGNHVESLSGILNGTTNFILTQMTERGVSFDEALADAQAKGFAEADPTLDVEGHDAAQKLEILAELAFGVAVRPGEVLVQGIRQIEAEDIRSARELGFTLKHVASAKNHGETLDLRVQPVLVPNVHSLAHVRNETNAVLVKGDAVGEVIFEGKGAGPLPTASAVLSDIVDIASNGPVFTHVPDAPDRPVRADLVSRTFLRFPILDVPGVIGLIATALGNRGISISHASASLEPSRPGYGHVKILAHDCRESVLKKSIEEISRLPVLNGKPVVLRILEE